MNPVKVAIIGCGNISRRYVEGCRRFDILDLVGCADLFPERAQAMAQEAGIRAYTIDEVLADPEIEIIINLTIPAAHAQVDLQVIQAGKSVHSEKPLAVDRADGRKVLDAAREQGVLVGCAPDTFLGGGIQTCRKLIDDGWIGEPLAATAFMMSPGHESWHPDPDFYYQPGGGPMFDMGPYYLTALVNLLGPVERVAGATRISRAERLITSQPKYGEIITVRTATHVTGLLNFAAGAIGTIIQSFDVWGAEVPRIEIYGTEGCLSVPDPNTFKGPVKVLRKEKRGEWIPMPLTHSEEVMRGIGVADMAYALRTGRPHRCSGELAFHVLDIMQACEDSSRSGQHISLQSRCDRPAPLPLGLSARELDE